MEKTAVELANNNTAETKTTANQISSTAITIRIKLPDMISHLLARTLLRRGGYQENLIDFCSAFLAGFLINLVVKDSTL